MNISKSIFDLSSDELKVIFKATYGNRFDLSQDFMINYEGDDECGYVSMYCNNTGYHLTVFNNYYMSFDSDLYPIRKINMLSIYSALIEIGAIQ